MKILDVTSHLGAGLGTVILNLESHSDNHAISCLDYANEKAKKICDDNYIWLFDNESQDRKHCYEMIAEADIVLVHWYDHPMLKELFSKPVPDCRMVFWCHKNYPVSQKELSFPDRFIDVSPIQNHGEYIWSTGDMTRFRELKPIKHKGFNIGYIGTVDLKKIHGSWLLMHHHTGLAIPSSRYTIVGEDHLSNLIRKPVVLDTSRYRFVGKVDDVVPYLAEMDVFGYPLRADHYGTCEQVLGEAMSAGIVPVVMANPAEMTIVKHGYNGLVSLTESEYVDNIKLLYDNKKLRAELSENAKVFAKELYSTETMISKWDEVFNEMMDKPKTSKGGIK